MDPYKIMQLPKNFTLEDLKERYRKLSLKTHPDRCGGDDTAFKIISASFKALYKELKARDSERPHDQLKAGHAAYQEKHQNTTSSSSSSNNRDLKGDSLKRFNEVFEKMRLADPVQDRGYGEFMTAKGREDVSIPKIAIGGKNGFNNAFENQPFQSADQQQQRQVERYRGPQALALSTKLQLQELGQDSVDDFTGESATSKLQYTDFMRAHTVNRLFDPSQIERRTDYRNLGQLEQERAQRLPFLDRVEMEAVEQQRIAALKAEDEVRMQKIRARDELEMNQYQQASRLLLR